MSNVASTREQTKKQTASSRVSEQRDGALPGDKERCKGEIGNQQTMTQPRGAKHLSACLAPLFCRISQSCAGAYAAEVLVLRLRLRWIIHPEGFISPLK
jgi:hypothetical protein